MEGLDDDRVSCFACKLTADWTETGLEWHNFGLLISGEAQSLGRLRCSIYTDIDEERYAKTFGQGALRVC